MVDGLVQSTCFIKGQTDFAAESDEAKRFFTAYYKKNKNKCLAKNFFWVFLLVFFECYFFGFSIEKFPSFHPRNVNSVLLISHILGFGIHFLAIDAPRKRMAITFSLGMVVCALIMLVSSFLSSISSLEYLGLAMSGRVFFCLFIRESLME